MSQDEGVSEDLEEALDWFTNWYHIPSVLFLFAFMLWVRARTWGNYVSGGEVFYRGNDAWYHLRQVEYTVRHWPETMPFEAWTNFPAGTSVSQFGTVFDQAIATVALVLGLGSPSTRTVEMTHLFAPAVIGALIVVPTYYLGKRVGRSRFTGVIAALIVALSTGGFLRRSLVGFSDHQVAEAFTQALAVLAIVVAIQVADREKPVWELLVDRDVAGLRRPVGYAALAGVATALYMWVWPPGVLLVGILGLYVTIQAAVDHLRGKSPESVLFVSSIVFLVTAILMLLPLDRLDISPVKFSLIQPGLALAGVAWSVALASLSRVWTEQSYPSWSYPVVTFGAIGAILASMALVVPDIFGLVTDQLVRVFGRLVGEQPSAAAATVGEVQPFRNVGSRLQSWYGFTHIIAVVGVLIALARQTISSDRRSELLFVVLWLAVIFSATYTQERFSYYLTAPLAVMAAYAIGAGMRYLKGTAESASTDVKPYQIMAVATVLLIVTAPMVMISANGQQQDILTQTSSDANPEPRGVMGWDSSLDWMDENTPEEGNYGGAGNELGYWDEFPKTNDFEYDNGSYGVLSWWDYGHWITHEGERIPVANPFQQSATDAARFLLAQNESRAEEVIRTNMSEGPDSETRYVMVDWKMATASDPIYPTKFFAPSSFLNDVSRSTYYDRVYSLRQGPDGEPVPARPFFTVHNQEYYEAMVNRLYRYHGSAAWPDYVPGNFLRQTPPYAQGSFAGGASPVPVTRTEARGSIQTVPSDLNTTRIEPSLSSAREYVQNNPNARIGGLGKFPSEHVPALKHYRLVHTSDVRQNPISAIHPAMGQAFTGVQQPQLFAEPYSSWTKTFERVPGATIEGVVPEQANTSVYATVNMRDPTTNQTFEYIQSAQTDEDGTFTMTLPYSTTGYDDWGTANGYTNVSVRAASSYTFTTGIEYDGNDWIRYNTTEDVTEAQVIGEDTEPLEITLSRSTLPTTNETDSTNGADGTNGTDSTNGTDNTNETDGNTSSDLVAPEHVGPSPTTSVRIAG
ncbi:MAG: oligosaccharyl transferase, archaeosortase A system-associated [Halapricum sp.]